MSPTPDHTWVAKTSGRFALEYRDDGSGRARAWIEGVRLDAIVAAVGTPTYVYGAAHIADRYRSLATSVSARPTSICYAVKANSAQAILRHLGRLGAGADIVSGGELQRAVRAGIRPSSIVFSGVGKTVDEIDQALAAGLRSINAESSEELQTISARAGAAGIAAPVSLRVNPDVDPATHPYLATGLEESKFGIAMKDARDLALQAHGDANLSLVGLACHIGSQIMDTSPFVDSFDRLRDLMADLGDQGVGFSHLDLGGGFGIAYGPDDRELDIAQWGRAVVEASRDLPVHLVVEPGRYLVGNAGVLLTRVILNKSGAKKSFVVVDAAMNDLVRPALYGAYHAIVPARMPAADEVASTVDIVGPVCESGDFLAKDRALTPVAPGDLLCALSAGAYGASMMSSYNTRPPAAEVLVVGDRWSVIRPRKTVDELIADDLDVV